MASKALINTVATIAMAEGMSNMVIDNYGMCIDMEQYGSLESVIEAAHEAFKLWPEEIDGKGMGKLKKMVDEFGVYVAAAGNNISAITSTVIAMLEDLKNTLLDCRASSQKIYAIGALLSAVIRCHDAFDPELDYDDGYVAAALLQNKWLKILEVA